MTQGKFTSYEDTEIANMFNTINGLKINSEHGLKHIAKYPEDKQEIVNKYETELEKSWKK